MFRRSKKSAVPYKQTPHQKCPPVPVVYAIKDEFAVSANMAYGEVKLGAEVGGEYEDPDKIVTSEKRENQQAVLYELIANTASASETYS